MSEKENKIATNGKLEEETQKQIISLAKFIDSKKGENLSVLDLRGVHTYLNYFILVTANSVLHAKSLAKDIRNNLSVFEIESNGVPDDQSPDWIVIDSFWLIIHIFTADTREFFALDRLWADAKKLKWR